ncbi:lytic transglycosylase domain-containing protein, partial [Xanthomonas phaseoli]
APSDAADAAKLARQMIAKGYSVDLGLMQVNSRNLGWLGYTVEEMFEPCKNIRAGAEVLRRAYYQAIRTHGEGQPALRVALSLYNTGDMQRGFRNGYVARYFTTAPAMPTVRAAPAPPNPYTAGTTIVFSRRSP